jgi:hypothetical protein
VVGKTVQLVAVDIGYNMAQAEVAAEAAAEADMGYNTVKPVEALANLVGIEKTTQLAVVVVVVVVAGVVDNMEAVVAG